MDFGGSVLPWTRHVRAGRHLVRRAFEAANKIGDLTAASSSGNQLITNLLIAGDPLVEAEREAEYGLAFAQKARFGLVIDIIATQLALIRTLRGLTPTFSSFDDHQFDERRIERHFSENPDLAFVECWYWIRKLQARFFVGDYPSAIEASSRAHRLLWTSASMLETAECHFYDALSQAASCDSAAAGEPKQRHLEAIAAHHKQLRVWAANCPENFENRAALVGAELARLQGRDVDAMPLYEQAIRSARDNGFLHNEALANELASRFYAARGFEKIARVYLQDARYGYLRWGADGKVRQLDEMYPHLRDEELAPASTSTIGAPVEHLDLATVIKVSQAVSSEIVLEMLIDALMRTAIKQAGAERGLLIVPRGAEPRIEAEATTRGDTVVVELRDQPVTAAVLPESMLHYVMRTRVSVILDDAAAQSPFAADPYLRQRQARSILCVPLAKQSKLIGVLYLENNLASHVFTPARISVLELLASQAAISLENARLYNELQEREARIRRLVDSNIVGIVIWDVQGWIIEANQAFLDMVGYAREDLVSGRLRWTELTPAEWRDADEEAVAELKVVGTLPPREKEYFRKDGSRVPVLVARALFEWKADEGVAFIIDMTDRKQAEERLRASEQRLLEAQMALAHANRVTTMGQLTASIAHEVKQPIGATVTNAQAALRFLGAEVVDTNELQEILRDIVKDGNRAGEVISRISDLTKKAPPRRDRLEINGAIREVIEFTRGEAVKNRVSVRTELADRLPLVRGDRVELQQVILNLVVNGIEAMQSVEDRPRELVIRSVPDETQKVRVSVADCGSGLSAENADRLFTAFFTTKSNGMGMGLSICRSIIEAHNGRLWATANAPHGATFQFTLPVSTDSTSVNLGP
jgi:PAS domain S-box-containing protein